MIGSILKIITMMPSLFKKAMIFKASEERNKQYEKLNEEIAKKDDKLSDSNLRNLLK